MRHIGRVLVFGIMLAAFAALAPPDVVAQKKKDAKDKNDYPAATDDNYKAIQKQKEIYGKLVAIDNTMLTLRAEYYHNEPNPKYRPPKNSTNPAVNQVNKAYNELQNQMQRAANAKPKEAAQAQQRVAQAMAKLQQAYAQAYAKGGAAAMKVDPNNMPFITVTNTIDYDLEIEEKVVTRKLALPLEYDDTGNVKTYSDKEKADLKGDDKTKPGYLAKFEELKPGQEVKLTLTPPKKKERDAEADKEKDKDSKEVEPVARPTVKMIVITKDNAASESPGSATEKKKKKNN